MGSPLDSLFLSSPSSLCYRPAASSLDSTDVFIFKHRPLAAWLNDICVVLGGGQRDPVSLSFPPRRVPL